MKVKTSAMSKPGEDFNCTLWVTLAPTIENYRWSLTIHLAKVYTLVKAYILSEDYPFMAICS